MSTDAGTATGPAPALRGRRLRGPLAVALLVLLTAMLATAANWLHVRQRVRISADSPCEFAGREGVVWRLCSPVFADRVYVYLDSVGNERSEKIAFAEVRDVEPIEQ